MCSQLEADGHSWPYITGGKVMFSSASCISTLYLMLDILGRICSCYMCN